ncbi:hypothetical protein EAE32_01260 [Kocuria tytonicola]|uniref:Major facilitator superfamily (MFS) profile domain-containing protein n=1 Tax=Kocuria tytonicola TaxID=2055946 RepID=A0A3L9L4G4_9MICC|nr:hypothetical protein [Kocuria tytonicola]RLY93906.1 hypothetical protein EAE32_01260 [Kocuria tytonicola]
MITSGRRPSTGRKLFWAGGVSLVLTVAFFFGGFALGNSFGPRAAMSVMLTGLVLSVIASLTTGVVAVAGTLSFPALRGRFVALLVLAILCSPLLWLLCIVALS